MSAQRITIPLPIMLNADAYLDWSGGGREHGVYTWYVRIKFGDAVIGQQAYSHSTQDRPSTEDIERIAADLLRPIFFPKQ